MLSCSDLPVGRGQWPQWVRGLNSVPVASACDAAVTQNCSLRSGVLEGSLCHGKSELCPLCEGRRVSCFSPPLSAFPPLLLHPSLLPFCPSPSFHLQISSPLGPNVIWLLPMRSAVSTTWLFFACNSDNTLGSFIVIRDRNHLGNGSGQKPSREARLLPGKELPPPCCAPECKQWEDCVASRRRGQQGACGP